MMSIAHILHHRCDCLRLMLFTTGYTKKRGRGLKSNSCRLKRTVGWTENNMRKSKMPANPVDTIKSISKSQTFFPQSISMMVRTMVNTNSINAHAVGVSGNPFSVVC